MLENQLESSPKPVYGSDPRITEIVRCAEEASGATSLRLKALSERLRVSEKHIGLVFKQIMGMPFRQFLRRVRMKKTASLLRNSAHTVQEIAGMIGYSDSPNFYRDFRRFFGLTPTEYRGRYTG